MNGKSFLSLVFVTVTFVISISAAGADYWQQEVNYVIDVDLADNLRTISGTIEIEYINNSPDTLEVLYLKAFPNAIQKGSYADLKRRKRSDYSLAELPDAEEGSLEVYDLVGHSVMRPIDIDNTIITVRPDRAIGPGDTAYLDFSFTTVLPQPPNMRMGFGRGVTKAVYWFPQACVYDHVLGWCNSQYIGWGEWYGDYGRYEVSITAPEEQIVAATGACINEAEVLPDSLRAMLDISNFLKPREQWPHFEFEPSRTKTWHYVAENVNDFVFTSSSHFCIDTGSTRGVEVVSYPLKKNAADWVEAVQIGKEAVETFSDLYIPYQWPAVRICDAYSGMEYPGVTNCGYYGSDKRFRMLLYHEIGHFWFMGHIGSNQADRPFIDEGFTTHAEHVIMEKYLGRLGNMDDFEGWYERTFAPATEDRNVRGFRPLMEMLASGYDQPMVFSYDQGPEYFPFRVSAYYKSAAMHYSLRSILGDSAYFDAMRYYCRKWLFKHPYENDYIDAMEEATGLELTEYLRQWYYGRDRLDYAFAGKKSESDDGHNYTHHVRLKREGGFVAPVDVAVIWEQGDTTTYTVPPEGMEYAKPGDVLLPVWKQFRIGEDEYEFTIKARREIDRIVVDPHQLLMDVNRLNNSSGVLPPIELRLDNMKYDRTPLDKYALRWRPDLWYDEPNGLQVGFHSHGSYLGVEDGFDLDARLGTESIRPIIDLRSFTRFHMFGRNATGGYHFIRADRRTFLSTGFEKRFKKLYSRPDQQLFRLSFETINVDGDLSRRFEPLPEDVAEYLPQPVWETAWTYYIRTEGASHHTFRRGKFTFGSCDLLGDYPDSTIHRAFVNMQHYADLELGLPGRTRLNAHASIVTTVGFPPMQMLKHISRVTAVERFVRSPLFRSPGTFPVDWEDDFYLAGTGVRGYQDRAVYFMDGYFGSLSLTPPDILPYRWFRKLPLLGRILAGADQALFIDVGTVTFERKEAAYPVWVSGDPSMGHDDAWTTFLSAGISVTFPPVWSGQRFRLDFPLYLNEPLPGEEELDFRFSVAWLMPGDFD